MTAKASTHRLEPENQDALTHLSKLLGKPKNRLINEAVRMYVSQRSEAEEKKLEPTLQALRDYRQKDPNFEKAIAAFVEAEVEFGKEDPCEGRPVKIGPSVQTEIQRLLHA